MGFESSRSVDRVEETVEGRVRRGGGGCRLCTESELWKNCFVLRKIEKGYVPRCVGKLVRR